MGTTDRKTALVIAAYRSIAERGFEGLRLREVAAEVGINHATLHHHFATKEDLVAAVVDVAMGKLAGTMPREGPPAKQLGRHLCALQALAQDDPALFTVLHELDLRAMRDEAVRSMMEATQRSWRGKLIDLYERGVAEGSWGVRLDPPDAAALTMAVFKGATRRSGTSVDELRAASRQLERWLGLAEEEQT